MVDWPLPHTVKQLRGFLGLTGYYMRFVRHYALISKPLTRILKKNAFEWDEVTQITLTQLKQAMTQAPVLVLPNFQKTFVVEIDASGLGIGIQWVGTQEPMLQVIRLEPCYIGKECIKGSKGSAYPGYLQPLPIPEKVWSEVSMDFIVGLPKSHGNTVIFVVVDRLSKYAHFMALNHPYTASSVAQVILDFVYKLHGLPNSIVSDKDDVFISNFWQSLFKLLKVYLKISTSYYPQTNGQTKVVNKCLECFLRCMIRERPKEWVQWLPLTEYWYNTNKHSSTNVTPFEVMYGQTPPLHVPYVAGESVVEVVHRTLQARETAIEMLKFHLKRAQDRMKVYANRKRSEMEFEVGMWVYLKLQPHRQVTIRQEQQYKLSAKYYGQFMILAKVGSVAYKLELPNTSQINPVFHVSQLKLCKGSTNKMRILPHYGVDGLLAIEPEAILDIRMAKLINKAAVYVLVKCANHSDEDATWELYDDLVQGFPGFQMDS
ncbi:retrotransposable element Tf2 [Tanacetum coccineum]